MEARALKDREKSEKEDVRAACWLPPVASIPPGQTRGHEKICYVLSSFPRDPYFSF